VDAEANDTQAAAHVGVAPSNDRLGVSDAEQGRRTRRWARIAVGCTAAALALTVVRVAQLKLSPPEQLDAAAGRRTSVRKELAQRGEIIDQRGRPLAMSLVGYKLYCDPAFIYESGWDKAKKASKTDPNAVAECDPFRDAAIALAPVLRQPPQAVHELLKANAERRYVVLAQDVDEAQVDALRTMDMDGIGLETKLVRDYPARARRPADRQGGLRAHRPGRRRVRVQQGAAAGRRARQGAPRRVRPHPVDQP
jgi:cell division protein FtsI/penicillin-binding protein 2